MPEPVTVYSTRSCGDCRVARRVLTGLRVAFSEVDIEEVPDAAGVVMELNGGLRSVPTIIFPDGSVLVEPSAFALTERLRALGLAA